MAAAIVLMGGVLSACTGGSSADAPDGAKPSSTVGSDGRIAAGATVVFVGDSIVDGYHLADGSAWPDLVGRDEDWNAVNQGCSGGGFLAPGSCVLPVAERLPQILAAEPDVIVIVASRNDLRFPTEEVLGAIETAVQSIAGAVPDALLLGAGDVWGPAERPSAMDDYNTALAAAVNAAGGDFLAYPDPIADAQLMSTDTIHPNEAGQRAIADAFTASARAAGLIGE